MNIDVGLIGVCLPCYLQDHHNRQGEYLVGVVVDGATTNKQLKDALIFEIDIYGNDLPESITDAMIEAAVNECFSNADLEALFDSSLEVIDDVVYCEDFCYAWFLVTWDNEESDD